MCESPRSRVFGGHHKEEDSIRCLGDAVAGIVGCLSSCLDSNSGPHDEAVFYSLHCFSTLPLSKFLFSFSFSSLQSFRFYVSFALYSSLVFSTCQFHLCTVDP